MSLTFDFLIIGAGVGGYPAAVSLAQMGYKVAIVEKDRVGGECTNYGCIPTKAMIKESMILTEIKRRGASIDISDFYSKMIGKRDKVVSDVKGGIEYVLEKNDVKILHGEAKLYTANPSVEVTFTTGERKTVEAKKVLIAVGSRPICPNNLVVDNERIVNSRSVLQLRSPPSSITIIGGGAVGVEYAFIFNSLGSEVHLIEKSDNVLPGMDDDIRMAIRRSLLRRGVRLYLNEVVNRVSRSAGGGVLVQTQRNNIESEVALIAIGRRPATDGIGLENAGVETDDRGFIVVDKYLQTSNPNFYAVGDAVGHPMLAHKAIYQSLVAARNMAGDRVAFDKQIPYVVYSIPYAGGVGVVPKKDETLEGKYKAVKFNYGGLSMAHIEDGTDGFLKIVYTPSDGVIIGAHAYGPDSDMIIAALTLAIEKRLTLGEIGETVYPHPSISEAIREATLIGLGKPIHTVLFHK